MVSRFASHGRIARITGFLRTHEGFWCNICMVNRLGLNVGHTIHDLTRQLGKARRYYEQGDRESCCGCDRRRTCIRFTP